MAPTYPFCNCHPGVPCIPKGRKVSGAGKGGAVERQWEGSSSFVHNIYEPLPYARKRCPVQGLIHLVQPSPFTHEASQLVEQPDFEQEHRERLPVSVWPGAQPCSALHNHLCRLLTLCCPQRVNRNHRAERNTQRYFVVSIIMAFTLCCQLVFKKIHYSKKEELKWNVSITRRKDWDMDSISETIETSTTIQQKGHISQTESMYLKIGRAFWPIH